MNIPFLKKYQPKEYKDFIIDEQYIELASMFIDNYKKFKFNEYTDYSQYGPIIPSKLICN